MQGTQTRLNFLPEKHTDFIFTTLAEELGFIGGMSLLVIYLLILAFCWISAAQNKDRFSTLLIMGVGVTFFLFFAVNMSMVMGLALSWACPCLSVMGDLPCWFLWGHLDWSSLPMSTVLEEY